MIYLIWEQDKLSSTSPWIVPGLVTYIYVLYEAFTYVFDWIVGLGPMSIPHLTANKNSSADLLK